MKAAKSFRAILAIGLMTLECLSLANGDDAAKKREKARALLADARRLAADYKIDKAAEKARDALDNDPSLAEAHVYLGLKNLRANDLKGAQDEFARALDQDPYQAAAHCQLAYVLYQQGQLEDATDHWSLSARLDPTSPQTLAGLALSQFKHGQEDDAVKTYQKALLYDRRFSDAKFLASDNGPRWSGALLADFQQLLAKVPKPSYP